MTIGYVDTSCLVAIAFAEPTSKRLAAKLDTCDQILSSNLLEAELRSALIREGITNDERLFLGISWIQPDRRLSSEIDRVLEVGYACGADLWHLACALYAAEAPRDLTFFTLDVRQRELAAGLGFGAPQLAPS